MMDFTPQRLCVCVWGNSLLNNVLIKPTIAAEDIIQEGYDH